MYSILLLANVQRLMSADVLTSNSFQKTKGWIENNHRYLTYKMIGKLYTIIYILITSISGWAHKNCGGESGRKFFPKPVFFYAALFFSQSSRKLWKTHIPTALPHSDPNLIENILIVISSIIPQNIICSILTNILKSNEFFPKLLSTYLLRGKVLWWENLVN